MSNPQTAYLAPASPPAPARPSSRRALTRALELAQEAVRIDATGDDPQAAVAAYARSVALLNEVMERVMRGDDSDAARRRVGSRRRSVVAKEDEARRLRSIVCYPSSLVSFDHCLTFLSATPECFIARYVLRSHADSHYDLWDTTSGPCLNCVSVPFNADPKHPSANSRTSTCTRDTPSPRHRAFCQQPTRGRL